MEQVNEDKDTQKQTSSVWLFQFLRDKFSLDEDKAAQSEVIENIRRGVEFKGTNLWVLIFATFIASLGLNVNSAAVIIGAMLVSPLMGPIMGIGLSLGINDFELMKRSLRNFGFMILVSSLTSTLYFLVSPISNAQSELLARTLPTTYDVLIAFFGGLAGIVAQSRKDRTSTVIPGVAIATALMPPLCTAGYGLATGQLSYFFGAFYLFFINTVFIAFATFFIVRFLKYDKKVFLDKRREQTVRRYMVAIMIVTIVPSVVIGYRIVQRSVFEVQADKYVLSVFDFPKTHVLDYKREYDSKGGSSINVVLVGDHISEDAVEALKAQLPSYGLTDTKLSIHQSGDATGNSNFGLLQSGYSDLLVEKNRRITELEAKLAAISVDTIAHLEISGEILALANNIKSVAVSKSPRLNVGDENQQDTVLVCVLKLKSGSMTNEEKDKLKAWLAKRTKVEAVKLYVE